jgi:hypothetical protein
MNAFAHPSGRPAWRPRLPPHLLDLAGGRRHPGPGHRRGDGPPGQWALRRASGQHHRGPLPPHHRRDGSPRRSRGRGAPGGRPGDGGNRPRSATLVTLRAEAVTRRHLLADCWQTTLRGRAGAVFCLVELRGFEPLTSCMPSRDPRHGAHHETSRSRAFQQSMRTDTWWLVWTCIASLLRTCCAKRLGRASTEASSGHHARLSHGGPVGSA